MRVRSIRWIKDRFSRHRSWSLGNSLTVRLRTLIGHRLEQMFFGLVFRPIWHVNGPSSLKQLTLGESFYRPTDAVERPISL